MIQLKDINKTYTAGDTVVKALNNININFREKEFVSILGPSGCGKTTLLNILGGLDRYDYGDIVVNGTSTKQFKDKDWDAYRNHYIGFVFQSYNLIPHLSIVENVELALSIGGTNKKNKRKMALDALEKVGLKAQAKKRPNQLSGGQMQRVAIARAIVNNPEIILADEPTGALDSETSVQVMDILKEISKEHLVIMVTHNKELADKYSTRVINLLDGNLVGDSSPFTIEENKEVKQTKKNKSAMSIFTAFSLSFKNLMSKIGKTLLVSFAGSIGIIGIALVLAVSTGLNSYIASMQSNALGNYPITVSAISVDMDSFKSFDKKDDTSGGSENEIVPYNPMVQYVKYGHYNNLTTNFVNKVKEFEEKDKQNGNEKLNVVDYNYYLPVRFVTKNVSGESVTYTYAVRKNTTSILSGSSSSSIYPMLDNLDFVMEQYDLIAGELPKQNEGTSYSTDIVLVVGAGNKISASTLNALGFKTETDEKLNYKNISFESVIGKEYKVVTNDNYYTPKYEDGYTPVADDNTNFEHIKAFDKMDISNQTVLQDAYNTSTITLKISGILRIKEDGIELLNDGLAYMQSFEKYYSNDCENSLIARKQIANKQAGNYEFFDNYVLSVSEISSILPRDGFASIEAINSFLNAQYGYTLSNEDAFEVAMQQIGISNIPISIKFFPKNFKGKDSIINMIDEFNATCIEEKDKIVYSDTTGFITSTLGQMVNIVSYVLIAFAAISLVVSSIMIGIITYTSVIERTKEIGVLRSIGARKKDISRVFNMETFIIGLSAGIIGVIVAFALTFPISKIIIKVAGGAVTTNIAILKVADMLILVAISTILTLIAGLIPARIAAKKDPVKALRSE